MVLKKYIKERSFGNMITIVLICVICTNFIGCANTTTTTATTNTDSSESVEKTNSETKNKLLTSLLNDLKMTDGYYDKTKANSLSNANRGSYMDDIGEKYIALIEKTYNSISDLENDKDKIATEKQTANDNVKKAGDDVALSYKIAGGGSGASTAIPYAKMNAARKEVCNALKTYFNCTDSQLKWEEMSKEIAESPVEDETITISSKDLYKTYEANEVDANAKYSKKIGIVTGKIKRISVTSGKPLIVLSDGDSDSYLGVSCYFSDNSQSNKIAKLKKGAKITIKGTIRGMNLVDVCVDNCEIQ